MSRLIDADVLRDSVKDIPMWGSVAAAMINAAPTLDAVPVVRGKWVEDKCYITCNQCNYVAGGIAVIDRWNYCPNCGAKMEGGE